MKFAWLLPLIFLGSLGNSVDLETRICDRLYKATCSPGQVNDGTGVAENFAEFESREIDIKRGLQTFGVQQVMGVLSQAKNTYFRQQILSTSGLSMDLEICKDADTAPSPKCLEQMAKWVTNVAIADVSTPGLVNYEDLEDVGRLKASGPFQQLKAQLTKRLSEELNQGELQKKIETKIWPGLLDAFRAKIDSWPIDEAHKKIMRAKLDGIHFAGTDCAKSSASANNVPLFMQANAFYETTSNTFSYCLGLSLNNTSEFHLAMVIAHELMHSIDPCGIALGPEDYALEYPSIDEAPTREVMGDYYPLNSVVSCLREYTSVGATYVGKSTGAELRTTNGSAEARDEEPSKTSDSDAGEKPFAERAKEASSDAELRSVFCSRDQIGEATADWGAAEVVPLYMAEAYKDKGLTKEQYRKGYSNMFRGMACGENALKKPINYVDGFNMDFDEHPPIALRIDRIWAVQPKVRSQMGCPELGKDRQYCEAYKKEKTQYRSGSDLMKINDEKINSGEPTQEFEGSVEEDLPSKPTSEKAPQPPATQNTEQGPATE